MTDNIVYGVDFKAKRHEPEGYDAERGMENQRAIMRQVDTSPSETNPVPYVAPDGDCA